MFFKCETCWYTFYTQWACDNHMDDDNHWPRCETCNESFQTLRSWEQHMDDDNHWPRCETCDESFQTLRSWEQHMDDIGHWPKCEICKCVFPTWSSCEKHINDLVHWLPTVPCETCDERFHTQALAEQHMRAVGHYGNYCKTCDQFFDNENNLRKHLKSKTHRGSNMAWHHSEIDNTTTSGSIRHLETASSIDVRRMNRQTTQRVSSYIDTQRLLTHQTHWRDDENRQHLATHRVWNGFGWECYVCHKEFARRAGLGNHLNSSAHRQRIYHCSNEKCTKEFSSLDGLFNHLESDACSIARFDRGPRRVKSSSRRSATSLAKKPKGVKGPKAYCLNEMGKEAWPIPKLLSLYAE